MTSIKAKRVLPLLLTLMLIFNSLVYATDYPTTWDLTKIFISEEAFLGASEQVNKTLIPELKTYQSKLSDATSLRNFLDTYLEASIIADKVYLYASLMKDTNTAESKYQEYISKALDTYANLEEATAFVRPELLKQSDATLLKLSNQPDFKDFKSYLTQLVDSRSHVLSEESENILAFATEFSEMPKEIYDQLTISDAHYDYFKAPIGPVHPLDMDMDTIYFYSTVAEDRQKISDAFTTPYSMHANTLASVFIAEVQKNIFLAKSRGYDSVLAYAVDGVIEPDQYRNLIKSTREHASLLQKFNDIKRRSLGFDTLHTSDFHLPYATSYYMDTTYEDSISNILEALTPLGSEYLNKLESFLEGGTIDAYPSDFKTTSQYTWGTYTSPTYVLLNFNDDFNSESTLSHELGHAIHQLYTSESQNYFDTNVGSFPAEATSTLNELLLLESLKSKSEDEELSVFFLEQEIELYYETFFMQAILADFEMQVYDMAEAGDPLSLDVLNTLWMDTAKSYFGENVTLDDSYKYLWMQIPHFYQTFYVYSYAMSLAASTAIKDHIVSEGDAYTAKYIEFLKSGASKSPTEQMKDLEIDLSSANFYQPLFDHFDSLLDEMDKTLSDLGYYDKHPMQKILYSEAQIEHAYKNYFAKQETATTETETETANTSTESSNAISTLLIGVLLLLALIVFISLLVIVSRNKKIKRLQEDLNHHKSLEEKTHSFDDDSI